MTDEIRQSIRLTTYVTGIVRDYAFQMWPELDDNVSGIINKIIADWYRSRTENGGGRMARIERLEADVALIKRRLGIEDEHDTDRG